MAAWDPAGISHRAHRWPRCPVDWSRYRGSPLNGTAFVPPTPAPSWGPLLDAVDRHVEPSGEIVAAVRFDGVDEPGFRDTAVLGLVLGSELIVEIDTMSPGALLAGVLDEASRSLPALAASACALAAAFRGAQVDGAARGLGQLAESLSNLVQLVAAAAAARALPLDSLVTAQGPAVPILRALDGHLTPILDAQRAGDWITVADILEYDIAPLMPRFEAVIDALRSWRPHAARAVAAASTRARALARRGSQQAAC